MENKEEIDTALEEFSRLPNGAVPEVLDEYLSRVAVTGVTVFPWCKVKTLLRHKLDVVVKEFQERAPVDCHTPCPNVDNVKFEDMHKRLLHALDQFNGTPFTIQRICELVTNPTKHYKKADKFMRGVEKNLAVVTTVDSFGNRIVSESKSLVNGIDASMDQTFTADQNKVGDSSFTEQSGSPCLPPVPASSPVADSTEANVRGSSWFTGLTSVVNSPSSYPKWRDGHMAISSLGSVIDDSSQTLSTSVSEADDDDNEPPAKRQLLDKSSLTPADDDVSTTAAVVAPLLGQLLSSPVESERQSSDDDAVNGSMTDTAEHDLIHSSNSADVTHMPSVDDRQHEDGESEVKSSSASGASVLPTVGETSSREIDNSSAVDSDNSNASSVATESENDSEPSSADLVELSSEGSDNEADELDMSFTETDNANACVDDVIHETVQVSTTTVDGPSANAINSSDMKLAAATDDDHRHFVSSNHPCADMNHDTHMLSQVAMDIN